MGKGVPADAASPEEVEAAAPVPRSMEIWKAIEDWMDEQEPADTAHFLQTMEENAAYKDWLRNDLLFSSALPASDKGKCRCQSDALSLLAELGIERAMRAVSIQALKKKMRAMTLALMWREWGTATICHIHGKDDSVAP